VDDQGLADEVYRRIQTGPSGQHALPYVFLGSGFSRRYLDLPNWNGLLSHFTSIIGADFDSLLAEFDGNHPDVAQSILTDFNRVFWSDPRFAALAAIHRGGALTKEQVLKVAIADYISARSELIPGTPGADNPDLAIEIKTLSSAVIDGIITTNYDDLAEHVFPGLRNFVGQEEMLFSDTQFTTNLYHIHGSTAEPGSLVVTRDDYNLVEQKNHYLIAKMLTIFVEHPIFFIGYSIQDTYIRRVLQDIGSAVGAEKLRELGRRLFFVEWLPDPKASSEIANWDLSLDTGTLPLTRISSHRFLPVFDALTRLERPFHAEVLRQLRKYVYDLVDEPGIAATEVVAVPIDSPRADGLSVVFGVGRFEQHELNSLNTQGMSMLPKLHLAQDVLGVASSSFSPSRWLEVGLPARYGIAATSYLPVFKYLRDAGRIVNEVTILAGLPACIGELISRNENIYVSKSGKRKFEREDVARLETPGAIMASNYSDSFKREALLLLPPDMYDIDDLRVELVKLLGCKQDTAFWRLVCHYDRLRYGPQLQS
jgi:hypothetical protein